MLLSVCKTQWEIRWLNKLPTNKYIGVRVSSLEMLGEISPGEFYPLKPITSLFTSLSTWVWMNRSVFFVLTMQSQVCSCDNRYQRVVYACAVHIKYSLFCRYLWRVWCSGCLRVIPIQLGVFVVFTLHWSEVDLVDPQVQFPVVTSIQPATSPSILVSWSFKQNVSKHQNAPSNTVDGSEILHQLIWLINL